VDEVEWNKVQRSEVNWSEVQRRKVEWSEVELSEVEKSEMDRSDEKERGGGVRFRGACARGCDWETRLCPVTSVPWFPTVRAGCFPSRRLAARPASGSGSW
jgi:hypothetical protein